MGNWEWGIGNGELGMGNSENCSADSQLADNHALASKGRQGKAD